MTKPSSRTGRIPRTLAELQRAVQAVLFTGRQAMEVKWVETYHETGRLISLHLLHKKRRATYGAHVYKRFLLDRTLKPQLSTLNSPPGPSSSTTLCCVKVTLSARMTSRFWIGTPF
jgi:hypothetical protein